jgi:hypothetical protein
MRRFLRRALSLWSGWVMFGAFAAAIMQHAGAL